MVANVVLQARARHELHDDVGRVAFAAVVEHLDDIWMADQRRRSRLVLEACRKAGVLDILLAQNLDRDIAPQHLVRRTIRDGEVPLANRLTDLVPPGERIWMRQAQHPS